MEKAISQSALQDVLIDALDRHQVPGASIAVFADGIVTTAVAGVTNIATGTPMTTSTILHIGSICKILNATLVMQLVDEGSLDLDESMLSYLPELDWLDWPAAERTTVRMLLNHMSGLNGSGLPNFGPDEETIEKGIGRLVRLPRLFEPGEECSYCNSGTVFAGYIVQCLRRKSWYSVVRERIFEPLQMEHAASVPEEYLLFSAAVGHFRDPATGAPVRTSRALLPISYGPAGATLMMSVTDLITFARANIAGGVGPNGVRILSQQGVEEMQRTSVNNDSRPFWSMNLGIGWWRTSEGLLNHTGGAPGVSSRLCVHPASGFAIAVLTNSAHGGHLADELILPFVADLTAANLTRSYTEDDTQRELIRPMEVYEGVYEDVGIIHRVRQIGSDLTMTLQATFAYYDTTSVAESEPAPLVHIGDDKFLWRARDEVAGPPKSKSRLYVFRGSDEQGRPRYIGNKEHVYRRREPG